MINEKDNSIQPCISEEPGIQTERPANESRKDGKAKRRLSEEEVLEYAGQLGSEKPVFLLDGRYFRRKGDAVHLLTNFRIEPVELIYAEDEAEMTADFITASGNSHRITLLTTEFSSSQKFKSVLNRKTISLAWFGSDSDLEILKTYLSEMSWPSRVGVKATGIHRYEGQYVFVGSGMAVDELGAPVNGIIQLDRYKAIESDILTAAHITADGLIQVGKLLLTYNEPAKTVAIMAWCSGCFLKQHFRSLDIKFPHLFLIGEAGSGKSTTLESVILPIFSIDRVQAATQITSFTLMKQAASSNAIPLCMDELKPSKMDKGRLNALYNHFRDAYDGHNGVRGKPDQSVAVYRLEAPIVTAGEESADEAAIRERSIELLFTKKDLNDTEHRDTFRHICMCSDLLRSFGRTLLSEALGTTDEDVAKWHKEAVKQFSAEMPGRVINNLACCYAGLRLIERMCFRFSLTWDEVFPIPPDECVKALGFGAEEYLLDGGTHNRSIVEQTFEIMARMNLVYGEDYSISLGGDELFIRISHIYDRYTRYRRDFAIEGEVLTYAQFRKQLRHSDLLIATNAQKRLRSGNTKGYIINYRLLKERADVEGFENY